MSGLNDFYRTEQWRQFRKYLIAKRINKEGFTICEECGKPIIKNYDIIAHHTEELTEGNFQNAEISLNEKKIMLVHHVCHNKIHNKLAQGNRKQLKRNVYIVYGSPLSGKTTYVKEIANEGDLIIDMDSIWECISGQARYKKPPRLNAVAFSVRDNLIECVKHRVGKWDNAYIIGGYPLQGERERLAKSLGARLIYIDSTQEECMKRVGERGEQWIEYIDKWWRQYGGRW